MKSHHRILISVLMLFFLAACSNPYGPTGTPTKVPVTVVVNTKVPTDIPTIVVMPSPTTDPTAVTPIDGTPTSAPTAVPTSQPTSSPTETPLPTPTETPPPVPELGEVINPENGGMVSEITHWGVGAVRETTFIEEVNALIVDTPLGIYVYQADDLSMRTLVQDATDMLISPDQRILATSFPDGSVKLWSLINGSLLHAFEHNAVPPRHPPTGFFLEEFVSAKSMAFSPDGSLLAAGYGDRSINIWNVSSGELVNDLSDPIAPLPEDMAITSDNAYLITTGSAGGIWRLGDGVLQIRIPKPGDITDHPFSMDNKQFVSSVFGGFLLVYRVPYGDLTHTISTGVVYATATFSEDGEYLIVNGGEQIRRISNGRMVTPERSGINLPVPTEAPDPGVSEAQLNLLGHISGVQGLIEYHDESIRVWGVNPNQPEYFTWDLAGHTLEYQDLPGQPQGNLSLWGDQLAFCNSERTNVMTLSNQEVRDMGRCRVPGFLTFSPDGANLARTNSRLVDILDVDQGVLIHNLFGHEHKLSLIAYSPDGILLASATKAPVSSGPTKSELKLWRTEPTTSIYMTLSGVTGDITALEFSPDSSILATSGAKTRLWRISDGWQIKILPTQANKLAFSPSGEVLASSGKDGLIHLWEVESGKEIGLLKGHVGKVVDLVFSADGTSLISISYDGTVRLWGIAP